MARGWSLCLSVVFLLGGPEAAFAQQDFSKVEVTSQKVAEGVYMLTGAGGNIGLSVGDDGVFLIDDQFAPLTPKIKAAVAGAHRQARALRAQHALARRPHRRQRGPRQGGRADRRARQRAQADERRAVHRGLQARRCRRADPAALPVVTFSDTVTFHLNGEEIHAFHVPPAHTDGDSIVHFRKANVIHMGDIFFNGMYPFIDVSSGGIGERHDRGRRPDAGPGRATTRKIIPGHGPLATKADLKAYRDMLATVRDRVAAQVKAGKTLEQTTAAKPLAELDAKWGQGLLEGGPVRLHRLQGPVAAVRKMRTIHVG